MFDTCRFITPLLSVLGREPVSIAFDESPPSFEEKID
jgi:hypothetical protein